MPSLVLWRKIERWKEKEGLIRNGTMKCTSFSSNPSRRTLRYVLRCTFIHCHKQCSILFSQATLEAHNQKMQEHFGEAKPKVSIRTLQSKLDKELITLKVCRKRSPLKKKHNHCHHRLHKLNLNSEMPPRPRLTASHMQTFSPDCCKKDAQGWIKQNTVGARDG